MDSNSFGSGGEPQLDAEVRLPDGNAERKRRCCWGPRPICCLGDDYRDFPPRDDLEEEEPRLEEEPLDRTELVFPPLRPIPDEDRALDRDGARLMLLDDRLGAGRLARDGERAGGRTLREDGEGRGVTDLEDEGLRRVVEGLVVMFGVEGRVTFLDCADRDCADRDGADRDGADRGGADRDCVDRDCVDRGGATDRVGLGVVTVVDRVLGVAEGRELDRDVLERGEDGNARLGVAGRDGVTREPGVELFDRVRELGGVVVDRRVGVDGRLGPVFGLPTTRLPLGAEPPRWVPAWICRARSAMVRARSRARCALLELGREPCAVVVDDRVGDGCRFDAEREPLTS